MIPPNSDDNRYKCSGAESLPQAEKMRTLFLPAPASLDCLYELYNALGAARGKSGKEVITGRMWKFRIAVTEELSATQEYHSQKTARMTPKAQYFQQRKGVKGGSVATTDRLILRKETH